jgi:hypothetical protein
MTSRVSVEDDKNAGWPSTSKKTENIEKIRELTHEDCRWTIHELADTVGICYEVCQEILTENLNMRHTAIKSVSQLLTIDQKQRRVNMYLELWGKANKDTTFIPRIITGDESWIHGYDPETKQQSSQRKSQQSPRAKKAWQARSSTKSMLIVFFYHEFVPPNTMVNSDFYCDVLRLKRKCATKKTGTLVQPQLASSSWQCAHPHVPENHRVYD